MKSYGVRKEINNFFFQDLIKIFMNKYYLHLKFFIKKKKNWLLILILSGHRTQKCISVTNKILY